MRGKNHVISISRKLGSEGVYIGKRLSEHFDFKYLDREILSKAAEELDITEEQLSSIEERGNSVWDTFFQAGIYDNIYLPESYILPTGKQLFKIESEIIHQAAAEYPCVVVGRCGSYLFREYPKHVSIFLHADFNYRKKRVSENFDVSIKEAEEMIVDQDKARGKYYNTYAEGNWTDASQYDICMDIGKLGLEQAGDILIDYIEKRFPELKK